MSSRNEKQTRFPLLLYFLTLLFLLALAIASKKLNIPVAIFIRDPAATGEIHPLSGIASHLGVLLLIAAGAICLFSRGILRSSTQRFATFLLCSGLMSIMLALDDLFMLHESIYPGLFGISEKLILLIYGILLLSGIVKFRTTILRTEYPILLVACGCFGLSFIVDGFQESIEVVLGQWRILLEDGFKLLGIVGWFGYLLRCSVLAATQ